MDIWEFHVRGRIEITCGLARLGLQQGALKTPAAFISRLPVRAHFGMVAVIVCMNAFYVFSFTDGATKQPLATFSRRSK